MSRPWVGAVSSRPKWTPRRVSARGSTTGIDWRPTTERPMREWGVRYHVLVLGKPSADVYVDDKAINALTWRRDGFASEAETLILERKFSG